MFTESDSGAPFLIKVPVNIYDGYETLLSNFCSISQFNAFNCSIFVHQVTNPVQENSLRVSKLYQELKSQLMKMLCDFFAYSKSGCQSTGSSIEQHPLKCPKRNVHFYGQMNP